MEKKIIKKSINKYIVNLNYVFSLIFILCSTFYSLHYKTINIYGALMYIIGLTGFFYSHKLKSSNQKYVLVFVWLIFMFYVVFTLFLSANFYFSSKNYPQENQSIRVILGTSTENNMPSPLLKQRLDLSLNNKNDDKLFIVSGTKKEAQVMKSYLLNKNIKNKNILKDENAFDTYTNIKNTLKIIKENNFKGEVVLFTNDFHCLRTLFYSNKLLNMPFKVVCSKSNFDAFIVLSFREFLAFFKAIIITSI